MRTFAFLLAVVALCAAAVAGYALYSGRWRVPDRWNPWAPLSIGDEPNVLTRWKLQRLSQNAPACMTTLEGAAMRYTPVSDRGTERGCDIRNAVRISATTARIGEPFTLTCGAAVSLALWETHVLQPQARAYFDVPVARIEHFGSYACRNVYGRENGRPSQHATADALDVAGFVLADGRRIRVLSDWEKAGVQGRFLHAVRNGACRFFDGVLSPDYNAAHRDHLHLDRGPFALCR